MIDIKKLLQQKSELKELWDYLGVEAPFPDKDVRLWLMDFSKEEVEAAFKELAKREKKVADAVKYVGKILHNSKLNNMTVEERAAKISAMRSLVGTIGAVNGHKAKVEALKREFAEVRQPFAGSLPEFAGGIGFGSGVGSGSDFDSATGTETGSDPAEPKGCGSLARLSRPPKRKRRERQHPNRNPKRKRNRKPLRLRSEAHPPLQDVRRLSAPQREPHVPAADYVH